MPVSMYTVSIPVFIQHLNGLNTVLDNSPHARSRGQGQRHHRSHHSGLWLYHRTPSRAFLPARSPAGSVRVPVARIFMRLTSGSPAGFIPTQAEIAELLEFAMEGRRRVKEQLKKMGSFEYYHTSFSYTAIDTGEERFVGVPEQGGRNMISADPLPPGSIYTATVAPDGTVGMYRVEVSVSSGSGKLRTAGGVTGVTKESINRAFSYMLAKKGELSIARELDVSDLHVEVIDLMNNRVEGEIGLAFFIAAFSALKKAPPVAAMLVLGDVSVAGNIKGLRSLVEPLQIAMDNGAKRALIPIENKRAFLEVTGDVVEHVDPIFFGDPKTAAFKALGLN